MFFFLSSLLIRWAFSTWKFSYFFRAQVLALFYMKSQNFWPLPTRIQRSTVLRDISSLNYFLQTYSRAERNNNRVCRCPVRLRFCFVLFSLFVMTKQSFNDDRERQDHANYSGETHLTYSRYKYLRWSTNKIKTYIYVKGRENENEHRRYF